MRTALVACWLSVVTCMPARSGAQYFGDAELDYWGEATGAPTSRAAAAKAPPAAPTRALRPIDEREFNWADYEDPSSDVFWDDGGSYVPPRPLRVAAAAPTPENVAHYLRWQRRKVETITALNAEVARQLDSGPQLRTGPEVKGAPFGGVVAPVGGLASPGRGVTPSSLPAPASGLAGLPPQGVAMPVPAPALVEWERLQVVFFYESSCPHCQGSLSTVEELRGLGAVVIPVQVDWQRLPPLLPDSVHYTAEIAREQSISSVPMWIASYRGERIAFSGEVSVQSIAVQLQMRQQQMKRQQRSVAGP